MGEFIASGLKLIISARHPKYKRNYVMVFCPGPNRYNDLQRRNGEEILWLGLFIYVDLEDKNTRQALGSYSSSVGLVLITQRRYGNVLYAL